MAKRKRNKNSITLDRLKEVLHYDFETGVFTWIKKSKYSNVKIGSTAGGVNKQDRIVICVDNIPYYAHRLAWLYEFGTFPKDQIDHINHNSKDNRIINLREVSGSINQKNRKLNKDNKSGVCGVRWRTDMKRWIASIKVDGKILNLGSFAEFSEAVNVRKNAEVLYGFHKNHGKKDK